MGRKKKIKSEVTIKSNETKILFAIILALLGLVILISPFLQNQTPLFAIIALKLGYSSIAWGILLIYISLFLFLKKKRIVSKKQAFGLFLFSLCLGILLSFWLADEQLESDIALSSAGGQLGKALHLALNGVFGNFIEIVIILVVLVISISLITGTTLEQIRDFVEEKVPEEETKNEQPSMLQNLLKKISPIEKTTKDIEINTGEIEQTEPLIEHERDELLQDNNNMGNVQNHKENDTPIRIENSNKTTDGDNTQAFEPKYPNWEFPSLDILQKVECQKQDEKIFKEKALVIQRTLENFKIEAKVVAIAVGPTVLRFSLSISTGTKVSKVKNLSNDLALALASQSSSLRIEAPIPGTSYIGIEIPNPTPNYVYTRDMVQKLRMELNQDKEKYELPLILGKDITGKTCIKDLAEIPHLLVAGATGTGKSVAINSILSGLLMTKTPDEVKFIMVDPKMGVEMGAYAGIPHLLTPVITDVSLVPNTLDWVIEEMMRRYRQLKQVQARKLTEYNKKMGFVAMPYVVIVIDEMADLMLTSAAEVETKIQRLAQMGRAVGIHLILATQKPTVTVITGLIKSNIPGRMAFAVATQMDSRVILDDGGAEALLGHGDMLFKDQTMPKALRIQGTFTSTEETINITNKIKEQTGEEPTYSEDLTEAIQKGSDKNHTNGSSGMNGRDPDFTTALEIVVASGKASSSFLQRKMRIGYNKAARLIEELEEAGAIGPEDGVKARKVLISSTDQILGKETDDENQSS